MNAICDPRRGSSSEYSSSNNVTPGHFIEAILDGSIVGPLFEYRERFGRSMWFRHQIDAETKWQCKWQWSLDRRMWEECGFPHIVTPGGFVDPMPQHLAIMEFLNFTRPLPPALRHQTRSGFRDGHFNASVKHLHGLTSKEVDRYFRPRLIQDLLANGIVKAMLRFIFIQGRNADI